MLSCPWNTAMRMGGTDILDALLHIMLNLSNTDASGWWLWLWHLSSSRISYCTFGWKMKHKLLMDPGFLSHFLSHFLIWRILRCLLVSWGIIHRSPWKVSGVFGWLAQFDTRLLSSLLHCWALAEVCAQLLAILVLMLFSSFKSAVITVIFHLQVFSSTRNLGHNLPAASSCSLSFPCKFHLCTDFEFNLKNQIRFCGNKLQQDWGSTLQTSAC